MNYFKPYIEYFSVLSSSDLLALVGIIVSVAGIIAIIIFNIWWDNKKKKRERFESFQETLRPFKHILETGVFPDDRANYNEFIAKLFTDQNNTMLKISDRLKGKRRDIFDQKWAAYKKQREEYNKPYWDTKLHNVVERAYKNKELLNLLNEILEIAKNN